MVLMLSLLAFVFAALVVSGFAIAFSSGDAAAIQRRLGELADWSGRGELDPTREGVFVRSMKWLGQMSPKSPSDMGKLRLRLVTAGYRANEALIVFCGIRVAVGLAFFTLFATRIFFRPNFFVALALCFIGYLIPGIFLARM